MSLFGATANKPTLNLGTGNAAPAPGTSLFGQPTAQPAATAANTSMLGASSQTTKIDLAHLRSTTRFDQLADDLQREIEKVDEVIYSQIRMATEVADLLPAVAAAGEAIPNGVDFVSQKLDELESGLGNDAVAVEAARDSDLKNSQGEARCVFRAVDRLKMPRQYQIGHGSSDSITGGVYGGSGLSGWWNNPQTLRGNLRAGNARGDTIQLPGEDADQDDQGPKNLLELFNIRAESMEGQIKANRELLGEIEDFVHGLEGKVISKERELNERLNYGDRSGAATSERDHQMQLLRYVFGEVQRSLYDVADKVGAARDDVTQLALASESFRR